MTDEDPTRLLRRALGLQAHAEAGGAEGAVAKKQLDLLLESNPKLRDFMDTGGATTLRVVPRSPWHCDLFLQLATDLPVNVEGGAIVASGNSVDIARLRGEWSAIDRRLNAAFEAIVGLVSEDVKPVPATHMGPDDAEAAGGGAELLASLTEEEPPQPIHPTWWTHYLADEATRQDWLPSRGKYARELRRGAKRLLIAVETVKLPRIACAAKLGATGGRRYGGE